MKKDKITLFLPIFPQKTTNLDILIETIDFQF